MAKLYLIDSELGVCLAVKYQLENLGHSVHFEHNTERLEYLLQDLGANFLVCDVKVLTEENYKIVKASHISARFLGFEKDFAASKVRFEEKKILKPLRIEDLESLLKV
jgi:hypothetical protein